MTHPPTLGLVLAGGKARRMGGGDKSQIEISGLPILDRVLTRLRPQCTAMLINANNDSKRFAQNGLPIVEDSVPDFAGPLAGILAGLDWTAQHARDIAWIVSVPSDCPFLPGDLVARLHQVRSENGAMLACAQSADRRHPVVGLWPVELREDLRKTITVEQVRKVDKWTARYPLAVASWSDFPVDPFFNVNTPEEAAETSRLAVRYPEA